MKFHAFEAMRFARFAHSNQVRKYTGDIRTTPPETVDLLKSLYASGVRVELIEKTTSVPKVTIRNFVANKGLSREPSMFHLGAAFTAGPDVGIARIEWAPDYFATEDGRIIGMTLAQPGAILKPSVNRDNGYHTVKLLEKDGMHRHNYVHRLVLSAFNGEAQDGMQCAHGDGDKANNHLKNLRWDTPAGNAADKLAHGTHHRGSESTNAKIDEATASLIKQRLGNGHRQADVSRELDVHISCVANIAQGKTWTHVGAEVPRP